jgi:hypothetical protein
MDVPPGRRSIRSPQYGRLVVAGSSPVSPNTLIAPHGRAPAKPGAETPSPRDIRGQGWRVGQIVNKSPKKVLDRYRLM